MTEEELELIEQRALTATQGPWEVWEDERTWQLFGAPPVFRRHKGLGINMVGHPMQLICADKKGYWPDKRDETLIVNAREDILKLVSEIRSLKNTIDKLKQK